MRHNLEYLLIVRIKMLLRNIATLTLIIENYMRHSPKYWSTGLL